VSKKQKKQVRRQAAAETKEPARKSPASRNQSSAARSSRLYLVGSLLLLAGLVAAAYSNSFRSEWHFDDLPNIIKNPYIRSVSLQPAALLGAMVQDRKQNRPFSNLTFALNYYFNRQEVWGYHLVNLLLHLVSSGAVLLALRLTFRRAGLRPDRRDLAALFGAAVWSVHPLQTQAVVYVVQRQTLMASAFMLLTLVAYILAREARSSQRRGVFYGLAALALILALGSKEIALATPALILLYELFFFQDLSFAFLRRHPALPALAVLVLAGILTLFLRTEIRTSILQGYQEYPFTLGQRLLTEPRVLLQYLSLILWPLTTRLSLEHDPPISTSLFQPWTTLPAILFWLGLLAAGLRYRRHPAPAGVLSFALFWYLGNLFLESSFLPLDLMFEHRLYLASLAVLVPLAAGAVLYAPKLRWTLVCLSLIIALLTLETHSRNRVWQTELGLWRDTVSKVPLMARPHTNLANVYLNTTEAAKAWHEYERSAALDPKFFKAYEGLGILAKRDGRFEQALQYFQTVINLRPYYAKVYVNRGTVYNDQGQYDPAIADFNQAVALSPTLLEAWYDRAVAYSRKGDYAQAIADCNRVLELDPYFALAYQTRGIFHKKQGDLERAQADFARAAQLDPKLSQRH